jgi:hypothetical protein
MIFRLSALLQGLESLYQIKIVGIEYVRVDFDENYIQNGVSNHATCRLQSLPVVLLLFSHLLSPLPSLLSR